MELKEHIKTNTEIIKTYKIPVIWHSYGIVKVEAESLESAIELAEEGGLPDGEYIDGSFEVDIEGISLYAA